MTYDGTCETLTGATIHSATRDGFWLIVRLTDKDGKPHELHFSGRTTRGAVYCGKCGEEKIVDVVRDKGRPPIAYCGVCSNKWELVA